MQQQQQTKPGIREFLNSPAGKASGIAVALIAIGILLWSIKSTLGGNQAEVLASQRVFVDVKTSQAFNHPLKSGESIPVVAPSGGKTGYPAEACYWTRDGKAKTDPDYVVLNETLGRSGPTFCPVCGRLVVGHNPNPGARHNVAPPAQADYKPRARAADQDPQQDDRR